MGSYPMYALMRKKDSKCVHYVLPFYLKGKDHSNVYLHVFAFA